MDLNISLILIVLLVIIVLLFLFLKKNAKDKKALNKSLNASETQTEKHEAKEPE